MAIININLFILLDWTENDKMHQCASSENLARLGLRVPQKVKKSLFTQPTTTKPLLKSEAKWVKILSKRTFDKEYRLI